MSSYGNLLPISNYIKDTIEKMLIPIVGTNNTPTIIVTETTVISDGKKAVEFSIDIENTKDISSKLFEKIRMTFANAGNAHNHGERITNLIYVFGCVIWR